MPYLLDRVEVTGFLDGARGKAPLSTLSLARLLGVSQSTITALARVRIFTPFEQRGKRQAWQFPGDTPSVFREQFATTSQVAALLQLPNAVVRNILPAALRRHGAEPVVGGDRKTIDANLVWRLANVEAMKDGLLSELASFAAQPTAYFRGTTPGGNER